MIRGSLRKTGGKRMENGWFRWFYSANMNFDWLDLFGKVTTSVALILATYVGYLKYLQGLNYKVRLAPSVSCTFLQGEDSDKVLISAHIANIGVIHAPTMPGGYPIAIYTSLPVSLQGKNVQSVKWVEDALIVLRVFVNHNDIQVGETVKEDVLVSIPKMEHEALKARLVIHYDGHYRFPFPRDKGSSWKAETIVSRSLLADNKLLVTPLSLPEGEICQTKDVAQKTPGLQKVLTSIPTQSEKPVVQNTISSSNKQKNLKQ